MEDKAFRRAVINWHDQFSEEKPREADNRVTVLACVLSWATRDGPLKRNVMDGLPKRSALILPTKTGRAFQKRYFALQWEKTCKEARIEDLHFHDIRGTTVTMLFQAGCNLGEIVSITGHSLRRAQNILDKYLARTSTMADNAIAKFENVLETNSAKRAAKQERQNHAK